MSEPKKFEAALDSDSRKTPVRVAFVTRRTSPHVKAKDDALVMTWPETLFRAAVAIEVLAIALVLLSLFWDAPLEELADPMQTPNPAKAPWYFLGLQELLHYFPPVIAGVLIPTMVIVALVVIPYFNINVEAQGVWLRDKQRRMRIVGIVVGVLSALFLVMQVWVILIPTLTVAGFVFLAAASAPDSPQRFRRWLVSKPLSFWIMTWFLIQASVLTIVGTFFRGAGWSWVWPWRA
jgi:quinol---cytochrome c reductase cytochrome c subunit, bacillus type